MKLQRPWRLHYVFFFQFWYKFSNEKKKNNEEESIAVEWQRKEQTILLIAINSYDHSLNSKD